MLNMGVRLCEICQEEHDYQSGFFTRHLKENHDMTLEKYVILTKYNNNPPRCKCGLCDEIPNFYRGEFKEYTNTHDRFKKRKELYLEKYGDPKCPTCGDIIEKWNRGKPRQYCNIKCRPGTWNQDKVNKTVEEKYGVDNVFQLESTKKKSIETNLEKYGTEYPSQSTEIRNKIKLTCLDRYGTEYPTKSEFVKAKIKKSMLKKYGVVNPAQIQKNRELYSIRMIEYNKNWIKNHTLKLYKETDIYYQSLYELDFLELCENLNILNKVKNGNTFKYSKEVWGKRLLTDFSIGDHEIEIKSTYVMERQGGIEKVFQKRDSVISNGKKYVFILDKDYSEFLLLFSSSLLSDDSLM